MSYKMKNVPGSEVVTCEKYINKMLKNEKLFSSKRSSATPVYQEKVSIVTKPSLPVNSQRQKQKSSSIKQQNPLPKPTPPIILSKQKDVDVTGSAIDSHRQRTRSTPRCRSTSSDRESWGQILHKNRSKDKISNFSNFDPLRTVHFLSKELHNKLQTLLPDDDAVIQMIADIQHALKRIPPEITSTLLYQNLDKFNVVKPITGNKSCQTPPTLYQEDTEKFQKIMEENTSRLEASCKQLEIVCTNLQKEKEMTERELDEARENVDVLCKKVRELEYEMEEVTNTKIRQLEREKDQLQRELNKALQNVKDNPYVNNLKKHIEELEKQKSKSEENCAKLEYDMALLKMEKEKFITILSIRDREIKEIQQEMFKIQDQVNTQLKKLNIEMLTKVSTMKASSDPTDIVKETKDNFRKVGDATISSINSNESDKDSNIQFKEFPCGDGEVSKVTQDNRDNFTGRLEKIKASNVDIPIDNKDCPSFEELLKGLSPSCKALITSSNT